MYDLNGTDDDEASPEIAKDNRKPKLQIPKLNKQPDEGNS